MRHFIYILQSADGRYYIGYTTDLDRRLKEHQTGSGGKFTKSSGAEKILYHESFPDKSSALKREAQLKGWSRVKKEALVASKVKSKDLISHSFNFQRNSQRRLQQQID